MVPGIRGNLTPDDLPHPQCGWYARIGGVTLHTLGAQLWGGDAFAVRTEPCGL
jgi:hypothetical protein